jgi:hypothetical protein
MDGRLEVWVPLTGGPPEADSESAPDGQAVQAERALVIVDRFNLAVNQQVAPLLERIDGLLDRLDSRELTIREQAEELGKLRQQVDDLQRRLTETDRASAPDGQPSAPWWRRWLAP